MSTTFYADPGRFIANNGKLDSLNRYIYSADGPWGFSHGRTAYTQNSTGNYPGLNVNGEELAPNFAVGGVSWSVQPVSI